MSKPVKFDATRAEFQVIVKICQRYEVIAKSENVRIPDRTSLLMDLVACHRNGCPLKLAALLAADDFNFIHDVSGITRHMDRETGRLKNCFLPRFHGQEPAEASAQASS